MKSLKPSIPFLKNKTVLILGAAGSIGSALARRIATLRPKLLIILDQDESGLFEVYEDLKHICNVKFVIANIRETDIISRVFYRERPQYVFHAAAYKHVVLMEQWPEEAHKTNIEGTRNVLNAAVLSGVGKFIFISSDKAVYPKSVMGKTKKVGEGMCLAINGTTKFVIVRFGNVMASQGSVIPIFQKQIAENQSLTVTHPSMKRYFMGIYEAVDLVLKAAEIGKGGEIFVLNMGKPIFVKDLAQLMIKISGKPLDIIYTQPGSGEKFNEQLMTREERSRAKKIGNLYVIPSRR